MKQKPLADRFRPSALEDIVGQEHLLGEGKPLRRIIESGEVPNLIFYGPSGVGKSTITNCLQGLLITAAQPTTEKSEPPTQPDPPDEIEANIEAFLDCF